MLNRSGLIRRAVNEPRLRVLVLFVLLLVAVALAWHLVGMADHSNGMMRACLALLVVVGLVLLLVEPAILPILLPPGPVHGLMLALGRPCPTGRSPPAEGTVLLM
jgi:hypothetical protein